MAEPLERYSRQTRYAPLGEKGQRRLLNSRVLLCGAGALGSASADLLIRAGVGFLRIVDRDFLELNNLQRQHLYDEDDVAQLLPKAEAAAKKLGRINSTVTVEARVTDLGPGNIDALARDADLIMDGTDNFETRLLINDYCIREKKPWILGACIGATGQTMTILPGETACYRCLVESAPAAGAAATCETAGILGSASTMVASLQVAEAIKILSGNSERINKDLVVFDLWDNTFRRLKLDALRERGDCPACQRKQFDFLEGRVGSQTVTLCGRNAVQVLPAGGSFDWEAGIARLRAVTQVTANRYLARATLEGYSISIFPDGRAIIQGTRDPAVARTLYARYLGG